MAVTTLPSGPFGWLSITWRLLDYWITVYRRTWRGSVFTSFLTPLLYVVAMGVLLGGFIKTPAADLDGASSYLLFVAPGLLAAQTMQLVFGETTYPVLGLIKWHKVYASMVATPLTVSKVVIAQLGFIAFRIMSASVVFILVMTPFGVFSSVGGALGAFFVQLLLGMAFATPIFAYSAALQSEEGFTVIFRLLMIPMFLFSGAFFPLRNLSPVLEQIARITPLWQGVDLTRMLALGTWDTPSALVHLAYLVVLSVAGGWLAIRSLARRLAK
ncbi:ABC transporter permease [Leekyejoonella antrihumi]|uniref:Transport permease protein n=1 Tax=Leekyejoonella antrihumi TaxID=1660198 RepID=A0A563E3C7_9MICO|nr:ABC transporter permease [Leekyejoonella antrihumi]TWP37036.1 ABC transporter [Leekyejoonella antrihumi]